MLKFRSLDSYMISGRGQVFMVPPLDFPALNLVGQVVDIDGAAYWVRAVEDCLVRHPYGICDKPAGLLVHEWTAQAAETP